VLGALIYSLTILFLGDMMQENAQEKIEPVRGGLNSLKVGASTVFFKRGPGEGMDGESWENLNRWERKRLVRALFGEFLSEELYRRSLWHLYSFQPLTYVEAVAIRRFYIYKASVEECNAFIVGSETRARLNWLAQYEGSLTGDRYVHFSLSW
jgi:hypothetical protein